MLTLLTPPQFDALAVRYGIPAPCLRAVAQVEGSGRGYDLQTGKMLIQFEPLWFKRLYRDWQAHQGTWIGNRVGNQATEWKAFNDAFADQPDAAMQATSIGLMQVMGFHYKILGFATVGSMWDFAKISEANQLELGILFIKSNPALLAALINRDWKAFARLYNGPKYYVYNYHQRLALAYDMYA